MKVLSLDELLQELAENAGSMQVSDLECSPIHIQAENLGLIKIVAGSGWSCLDTITLTDEGKRSIGVEVEVPRHVTFTGLIRLLWKKPRAGKSNGDASS
ncbi:MULTISPECIES: hypothetical protein [unclassified Rhizobium]